MSTIIFTGGGTAGHVMPNITLIPYLHQHFEKIVYIGSEKGPERKLVARFPFVKFYPITTAKLIRSFTPKNLLIPFLVHKGKREALQILKETMPDVIFSKGGYVALPVALAGTKLGIPMISHESDFSLGLSNKITSKFFDTVCTTFPQTADKLKNGLYVGPPFEKKDFSAEEILQVKKQFKLSSSKPILLVVGGSQGSASINKLIEDNITELTKTHQVVHLTGRGKLNKALNVVDYHPIEFTNQLNTLMSIADLAITRGGSNTIFELLAYNVPMLIIPLSKGSRGDQIQNAKYFESQGNAITLLDNNITSNEFIESFNKLRTNARKMRLSNKNALPQDTIQRIVALLLKYKKQ